MKNKKSVLLVVMACLSLTSAMGCAAAAVGAAAGVAGTIAYTDRGVKTDVHGDVAQVTDKTKDIFKDMKIVTTGTQMKDSGKEHDVSGKQGDNDVTVTIKESTPGISHVEVIAKSGTFNWNKDYAKKVMDQIIKETATS